MDKPTVLKVAKLARIKVGEDKIDHYVTELTNIMNVIEELNTADTKGLEPLVNVSSEFDLYKREDIVTEGDSSKEILQNAPQKKFGYFTVPKVIK